MKTNEISVVLVNRDSYEVTTSFPIKDAQAAFDYFIGLIKEGKQARIFSQ